MKRIFGVALCLGVLMQLSSVVIAADQGWVCPMDRKQAESKMKEDHAKRIEQWTKIYKLSPDQKDKISGIMIKYRDMELDQKDKLIDSIVTAINDSDAEIKAVLTPEQIDKYEEIKLNTHKDLGERMKEWFQSGMCY